MANLYLDKALMFTCEEKAFPGVNRVAELVKEDIFLVTGFKAGRYVKGTGCKNLII